MGDERAIDHRDRGRRGGARRTRRAKHAAARRCAGVARRTRRLRSHHDRGYPPERTPGRDAAAVRRGRADTRGPAGAHPRHHHRRPAPRAGTGARSGLFVQLAEQGAPASERVPPARVARAGASRAAARDPRTGSARYPACLRRLGGWIPRSGPRHRADGIREIHHARVARGPDQPQTGRPHHHHRRSDRVHVRPRRSRGEPARGRVRRLVLRTRHTRRPAREPRRPARG